MLSAVHHLSLDFVAYLQIIRTRYVFGYIFTIAIVLNVAVIDTLLTALMPYRDIVGSGSELDDTGKQAYYGMQADCAGNDTKYGFVVASSSADIAKS